MSPAPEAIGDADTLSPTRQPAVNCGDLLAAGIPFEFRKSGQPMLCRLKPGPRVAK